MRRVYPVVKLDGRYSGVTIFAHFVNFDVAFDKINQEWISADDRNDDFVKQRNWAWSIWGPGTELDKFSRDSDLVANEWAWRRDQHVLRLYLRGSAELILHKLVWT